MRQGRACLPNILRSSDEDADSLAAGHSQDLKPEAALCGSVCFRSCKQHHRCRPLRDYCFQAATRQFCAWVLRVERRPTNISSVEKEQVSLQQAFIIVAGMGKRYRRLPRAGWARRHLRISSLHRRRVGARLISTSSTHSHKSPRVEGESQPRNY